MPIHYYILICLLVTYYLIIRTQSAGIRTHQIQSQPQQQQQQQKTQGEY